ncbi:MAG: M48 family metallopeptidase [Elusimicrobiota bacterium]|jgi:predicted Zn-dependent protease|nr:M48 family metallopeptidase [Elusimicrobiota bacterium]
MINMKGFNIWLLSLIFLSAGCSSVGITGRSRLMLVSQGEETALGLHAYQEILKTSKISTDAKNTQLVNKVGARIAAASGVNYDWRFTLIEDKQINAFCLPGGKVAVYTGILPYTQTEEGLAVVMAHEVAHALARHGAERMSQEMLLGTGLNITGAALDQNANKNLIMSALGAGGQIGVLLPYSRKHELEADRIGLILMAKAGYNPQYAVEFWQRMAKTGNGAAAGFLSTHPSDSNRISEIQKYLPEAMQYYRRNYNE